MALTKYFVILFLVYLNFDISPLNSAAIPEINGSSDSINENDDSNSENYSTTVATDDDIGKIFEPYENLYIKNSNWFKSDDELARNLKENITVNSDKSTEINSDEESTTSDLETTEPSADDVVDTIHNIMDERIDTKKNRTDRTIVVVVTTNVFNINGSDDTSKRQHTLLSFGTPGMIQKETSTDTNLAMHNKITTEFFNSNPSPITEQSGTIITNDNETSSLKDSGTTDSDDITEEENFTDVSTTEKSSKQGEYNNFHEIFSNIDIRQFQLHDPADIQNSRFVPAIAEHRNFDEISANDDPNDISRIMKVIPSRSDDETGSGVLSTFEIPDQEPDSSLMEAMENILDTDVRKAFERDIPQTHHVPLDINIEEEDLYAPLKDLRDYIVEEVPINGNYKNIIDYINGDDAHFTASNIELVEPFGKVKELRELSNYNQLIPTTERVDNPIYESVTELPSTDVPKTTEEAITREAKTTKVEVTKTATEDATTITEEFELNTANQQIDGIAESEEESTTTTTSNDFQNPIKEMRKIDEVTMQEEVEEIPEKSDMSERDEVPKMEHVTEAEQIEENKTKEISKVDDTLTETETQEEISEISNISNDLNSDNESTTTTEQQEQPLLSIESDRQLRHTSDGTSQPLIDTYEKVLDLSFKQFPKTVNPDTTTASPMTKYNAHRNVKDFENYRKKFSGTTLSNDEITTILDGTVKELGKYIKNLVEEIDSMTTNSDGEDVVSEVVKVDEATTEQHQIIKKPGVDDDVEIKPIKVTNVDSNDLLAAKTTIFESRSFSDNEEPVDPLRTLVEGVELTAEITKAIDNFQSLIDPNDSIHYAANQVVENKDGMALVKNDEELNSGEGSLWEATARYMYIAVGALSIGLIVLVGVVSVFRFRQFKRNILFSC